ncbi:MAG: glycosyltransferase [Muribaculaceae bacterium]|nr:glycosyltransferase [Muribaculaceae bacterium]
MRICIINHSDTLGGASVVSRRLMHALRDAGHDARMLVTHKGSDDAFVEHAGRRLRSRVHFLAEHLRIFAGNGFDRDDLFKVSIATDGLPLGRHRLVREADAVILNWVNQGMLSLNEIGRIASEKPVIWTMHDMWNLTGICHHAGECVRYAEPEGCHDCHFLHRRASSSDLSHRTFIRKQRLYEGSKIVFVPVSSWLADKCASSVLLRQADVRVIPNAFPVEDFYTEPKMPSLPGIPEGKKLIVMGAARLDDPVKGLHYAVEALNGLRRTDAVAVFFGALRDASALDGLRFPYVHSGMITDSAMLRELYARATVVMSTSLYETLPGTLVEGQAAGCTPVSFDSGGQRDIIDDGSTGHLIRPYDTAAFSAALDKALDSPFEPSVLRSAVEERFSSEAVAGRYLDLIAGML